MEAKKVIVRFPPSPTGLLHVGGVRTALYNYIFAKQNQGELLMRIEDTDKERSKKEYETDIFDSLSWLGIDYDNKGQIWRQSERTEIYRNKIQELIKKGAAYLAEESNQSLQETEASENKEARPLTPEPARNDSQRIAGGRSDGGRVVRFKNPGGKIKFQDLIRGEVEIDVGDLNDFVIAKNINEPLYHLTVVVDDLEMGVTHVIRGEDHISNTPRQILILEALGGERPVYAHLPLVLAEDKSKLSKRKHGESVSLKFYKEKGYEPEAILNFLALVGWNGGTDKEIFTLEELIKEFDISKVQKKGGVFNIEKLNWVNKEHILRMEYSKQFSIFNFQFSISKWKAHEKSKDEEFMKMLLEIFLERIHRWGEVSELINAGEFDYLFEAPTPEAAKICWKNQSREEAKNNLEQIINIIGDADQIMQHAERVGKGEVLWPLRYALSGKDKSPDPFYIMKILGEEESKNRVLTAIKLL